jgi:hypothetical protein
MFTDHGQLPDSKFIGEVASKTKALVLAGIELNIFADAFGKPKGKIDREAFFHLLVGFDPCDEYGAQYWVNKVYETCGREKRTSGSETIIGVPNDVRQVIECLSPAKTLLIPAHLHSRPDAFRSRSLDDIYEDERFFEYVPSFSALEFTDKKSSDFFDGQHEETKFLEATCVRSSDAHEAKQLGTRPTWVQMQEPTFDELRASLGMRQRVSLDEPLIPDSYIAGMHVDGIFLKDFWLTFSPHCNIFIGVKGSGKTAALECLRFVLGVEVPKNSRDQVKAHLTHILGSVGRVSCLVRRSDGVLVLVERSMANPDQFQMTFAGGRTEVISQVQAIRFPAQILGWHEIEHAATDSSIRRKYMDAIAGPEEVAKLESNAKVIAEQIKYLHEQAGSRYQTFRTLHEQIILKEELRKGLQELNDSQLIDLKTKYENAIAHREEMRRLSGALAAGAPMRTQKFKEVLPFATPILPGDSPLTAQVTQMREELVRLLEAVESFSGSLGKQIDETQKVLESIIASADQTYSAFAREYEDAVSKLTPEKKALLESHRQVLEQTRELPSLKLQMAQAKKDVEESLSDLINLCREVSQRLEERTELRREKLANFSKGLSGSGVKLELLSLKNTDGYSQVSSRYRNGYSVFETMRQDHPGEATLHKRLGRAYEQLLNDLVSGYRVFFSNSEFTYYLTVFEDDDLAISFDPSDKGTAGYRPLDQLSAGQRCTAMFPLLLKLRQGPLVIDQPEDNLDNRHIAGKISPVIADDKKTRQIMMTSHNANLLVLSDPENIVVYEGRGAVGEVIEQGFLGRRESAVTRYVLDILDGGEKALAMRNARYGQEK